MTTLGERLRREREARRWSIADQINAMNQGGYELRTSRENLARSIRRWEAGHVVPDTRHQQVLAQVYGLGLLTLFAPPLIEHRDWPEVDVGEIVERIRRSDLDEATLDGLAVTVDQLCTRYSTDEPRGLLSEAGRWLTEIDFALNRRSTPNQSARLFGQAAWLALLMGCLANDLGDRAQAERMRATAGHLAHDAGDGRAQAWSQEMLAWFALTDGEWRAAIAAAEAGQALAPHSDVAVQLAGQTAEAWAQLGDEPAARKTLERGRIILDGLPWPENPRNHFVVDAPKARKPIMRVARILGDADMAQHQAEAIIREGLRPDGTHRQPMRVADAKGAMAAIAAAAGDIDQAVDLTHEVLDIERLSRPSLVVVTSEVLGLLPHSAPKVRALTERAQAITGYRESGAQGSHP
jgi:transcriptional regulator with XRE-family HTH domain